MITHGRGYLFGVNDNKQYEFKDYQKDNTLKVAEEGEEYV